MAPRITIPVDVHLMTLTIQSSRIETRRIQVGRGWQQRRERVTTERAIPPGKDAAAVRGAFSMANRIFTPADIVFQSRRVQARRVAAPENLERVNARGFFALARQFPASAGCASFFVVRAFQSPELGGQAARELRACIVEALSGDLFGKVLAHEFGHLVGLDHPEARTAEERVASTYNVMHPGVRAGDRLTTEQIARARGSALARAAGSAGSASG